MSVWLSWDEINAAARGRKVVFWGKSDHRIDKANKYLTGEIAYIVDSNPVVQNLVNNIYLPEVLLAEKLDEVFVIITTSGFTDVVDQLEAYGFVAGKHFCVSPTLRDFEVLLRIKDHLQIIYFTSPDSSNYRGGLYQLSLPSGKTEKILDGQCHGVIEGRDYIYLVDDSAGGVRVLDRMFNTVRTIQLPEDARPHGIAYSWKRDQIAVAFSGRDSIGVYDTGGVLIVEIPMSDKYRTGGLAEHHVNDLCSWKDSLYVTMFSVSGNWKREIFDGAVLEFDLNDPFRPPLVLVADLWFPHTPTIIRETLHFCESMTGEVWAGNHKLITEFHGFVRGVAYDGHFYYVGQSQHRYITRRLGAINIPLDTGIFLVDDKTKATKFYSIPALMDINSIMILREQV